MLLEDELTRVTSCEAGRSLGQSSLKSPSRKLANEPSYVFIHRVPCLSRKSLSTLACCRAGVFSGLKVTKRTPSNRASPLRVPIHKYPSGVWAREVTELSGSPSPTDHTAVVNSEASPKHIPVIARQNKSASTNHQPAAGESGKPHRFLSFRTVVMHEAASESHNRESTISRSGSGRLRKITGKL